MRIGKESVVIGIWKQLDRIYKSVIFCLLCLFCLFCTQSCSQPTDDELRPVVLITVRGLSSDIASLRVSASVNGAPGKNEETYTEGLGAGDVAEYRFAVRLPARTRGRVDLTLRSYTPDGCLVSENAKESASVEPGQFQELPIELKRFPQAMCPLTISRLGGEGKVRWTPRIGDRPDTCGGTCTEFFPRGQQVTLTADGNDQTALLGWEGPCSGRGECRFVLDTTTQAIAHFMPTLRVSVQLPGATAGPVGSAVVSMSGTGKIDCPGRCADGFLEEDKVRLVAQPPPSLCFLGWGGACSGNGRCDVTIKGQTEVTASFVGCVSSSIGTSDAVSSVWTTAPDEAWAVTGNALLKFDGKAWSQIAAPDYGGFGKVWSSGKQGDVWFTSTYRGSSNCLTRRNLSGSFNTYSEYASALWAYNADEVWFTSSSYYAIGRVQNGAAARVTSTNSSMTSLHGVAANDIWAVGSGNTAYRWDGTAWKGVMLTSSYSLNAVYAISPTSAWAVGDAGTILRWDGTQWSPVAHGLTANKLTGVWGSSAYDIWVVGLGGVALHWDGNIWVKLSLRVAPDFYAIHGVGGTVWAVGSSSTLLQFTR